MAQFYILIDEARRSNALEYIKALSLKKPVSVEIKEYRKNRSGAQNRTYWMWVNLMAEEYGYEPEELHESFKKTFLGEEDRIVFGKPVKMVKGTTKLTTQEFADYMTKIELTANQMGLNLPHPDDYRFAMMVDEIPAASKASLSAGSLPNPQAYAPEGDVPRASSGCIAENLLRRKI